MKRVRRRVVRGSVVSGEGRAIARCHPLSFHIALVFGMRGGIGPLKNGLAA